MSPLLRRGDTKKAGVRFLGKLHDFKKLGKRLFIELCYIRENITLSVECAINTSQPLNLFKYK
jgi:hypothetical protein